MGIIWEWDEGFLKVEEAMNSLRSEISAACLDFCLSFSWGWLWLPPPHSTSCRQEPAWSHRRQLIETGWGPQAEARSRPCPFIHFFLSIIHVRYSLVPK